MTPELIAALCTGIVTVIAAIGAMIVSVYNGVMSRRDADEKAVKLREIKEDASAKDKKLDKIEILVDGRMSVALDKIAALEKLVAKMTGDEQDAGKAVASEEEAKQHHEKLTQAGIKIK